MAESWPMSNRKNKIIIDESITTQEFIRFEVFAKKKGIWHSDHVNIRDLHSGIPDEQILHHFLNETTLLVTKDRPFHNTVLSKGLKSYYIGEEKITEKPLHGIQVKANLTLNKSDHILKESYHQPTTQIRHLLIPNSPSALKKLTTKRRRIRNYFGGQDHLEKIAVTVTWKSIGLKTLIGYRIRISSNVGIKAIDTNESYIIEIIEPERRSIIAISYALMTLIRLMLYTVKTEIYYDTRTINNDIEEINSQSKKPDETFYGQLAECFQQLAFVPVSKGTYIEKLRAKLDQLARDTNTNEIVSGNITEIMQKVKDFKPCITIDRNRNDE